MSNSFKVGDLAMLKSGSPPMSVFAVKGDKVTLIYWSDNQSAILNSILPSYLLTPIDSDGTTNSNQNPGLLNEDAKTGTNTGDEEEEFSQNTNLPGLNARV